MNKGLTMNSRRILKLFPFYFFVMMFLLAVGCSSGGGTKYKAGENVIVNSKIIGADGGTIQAANSGTPIDGVIVKFPAGALSKDINVFLGYNEGELESEDGTQNGFVLVLDTGEVTQFEEPISITVPFKDTSTTPVPYYVDSLGKVHPVQLVSIDREDGTFTFETFHASSYRWNLVIKNKYISVGTIPTGFSPEKNGFQIENDTNVYPGGACLGLAAFSVWYFINHKEGNLYAKYIDKIDGLTRQEIIASRAYTSIAYGWKDYYQNAYNKQFKSSMEDVDHWNEICDAIKATGQPVILQLRSDIPFTNIQITDLTHAVVAYEVDTNTGKISIYDPSFPGISKSIVYDQSAQEFNVYHLWNRFGMIAKATDIRPEESFEHIIECADNYFSGDQYARITVTSHESGQQVSDGNVTLRGQIISAQVLVNKLYVYVNYKEGMMPYEASVGDDGYFILPIQLVRGYNKLTFEIYGKTKESGKQYLNFVMEPQDGFVMEFMPVVTHAMSGTIHVGNNSGPALSGATVSIAGLSTTTNSAGTFTIIGIPAGTYAFSVSKLGYDTYTNPAYYVGADQSSLNFYLTQPDVSYSISGTIHAGSNSGSTLSGATVSIAGLSTTTNSAGTFTIIGIPAGTYAFSVSKPGYDTYTNPAYYVGADQSGLNFYLAIINVDPLNAWHLRSSLSSTLKSVVYGNNAFVAVGGSNVANSLDGVSWSSQVFNANLASVAYGNDTFFTVGFGGVRITSPDGSAWTIQETPSVLNPHYTTIGYGNGTFVMYAGGLYEGIYTSTDGITGTGVTVSTSSSLSGVCYGNNIFVFVGGNGTVLTSSNGSTWTTRDTGVDAELQSIAYGNGTFVAVGYYGLVQTYGIVLTSPDGIIWTPRNMGNIHNLYGIAYGNGTFVAVGLDGLILSSPDGITWTQKNSGVIGDLFGITFANNKFVTVGENGIILQSD